MDGAYLYVPILKWKKGEAEALKSLFKKHKDMILPLIEITDYQDPDEIFQSIESSYPYPVYIDTLIAAEDDRDFLVSIVSMFTATYLGKLFANYIRQKHIKIVCFRTYISDLHVCQISSMSFFLLNTLQTVTRLP